VGVSVVRALAEERLMFFRPPQKCESPHMSIDNRRLHGGIRETDGGMSKSGELRVSGS
jgi:hypothetical protein